MILEALFHALAPDRVLLATRSVQRNAIVGRFGFGEGIAEFTTGFALPLDESNDLFRVSLARNQDVFIEDCETPAVWERIPAWFRALHGGRSFLLLPISVERKLVGLLYADCGRVGQLRLGPRELSLAKTLRNQAILAIRQKSPAM
jgi:GAF domain-containing protein